MFCLSGRMLLCRQIAFMGTVSLFCSFDSYVFFLCLVLAFIALNGASHPSVNHEKTGLLLAVFVCHQHNFFLSS